MPDWCSTSWGFRPRDNTPEAVAAFKRLYDNISEVYRADDHSNNSFHKPWLGNLLIAHGFDYTKVYARGSIEDVSKIEQKGDSLAFEMETETAYEPLLPVMEAVLSLYNDEDKDPLIEAYYIAECGCDLYLKNDESGVFFPDKIIIYSEDEDGEFESTWYDSQAEAIAFLLKKDPTIRKALNGKTLLALKEEEKDKKGYLSPEIREVKRLVNKSENLGMDFFDIEDLSSFDPSGSLFKEGTECTFILANEDDFVEGVVQKMFCKEGGWFVTLFDNDERKEVTFQLGKDGYFSSANLEEEKKAEN